MIIIDQERKTRLHDVGYIGSWLVSCKTSDASQGASRHETVMGSQDWACELTIEAVQVDVEYNPDMVACHRRLA